MSVIQCQCPNTLHMLIATSLSSDGSLCTTGDYGLMLHLKHLTQAVLKYEATTQVYCL